MNQFQLTVELEAGHDVALRGLALSYEQKFDHMLDVAYKLSTHDDGENKFLESMVVWLRIVAPRYWWQEFDTYRIGVTKQSGSTMHTILKRPLTQDDFVDDIPQSTLDALNDLIADKRLPKVKALLPEGFMQERYVCLNYKVLRHIIKQRRQHKLHEWQQFVRLILEHLAHPEYLKFGG
jgi:hypothetical protein